LSAAERLPFSRAGHNAPTPAWLKADVARVGGNGFLDGAQIEPFAHGN
jgi:hypothetical protein